jgi:hypothetical protein
MHFDQRMVSWVLSLCFARSAQIEILAHGASVANAANRVRVAAVADEVVPDILIRGGGLVAGAVAVATTVRVRTPFAVRVALAAEARAVTTTSTAG